MIEENSRINFQRGAVSLVILALLKKEDMYGYQLVQEISRCSGGRLITQEGSLYPVLYKLVNQGFISDYRVQAGKRMVRVYYHIEPSGEEKLADLIEAYQYITDGVFQIIRGDEQ